MEESHDYMSERMTGLEAYRALQICLEKWYDVSKEEYVQWLASMLYFDPALKQDWRESIEQMIEERKELGDRVLAHKARGGIYRPCKCQDVDTKRDANESNELRNVKRS